MDIFSGQQLEQLKQAQEEAETNKKTREKLSKLLGIPEYEIVAPNLFRAASLFGLLSKNSTGSILDMFSSGKQTNGKYSAYTQYPVTTEQQRLKLLQKLLSEKTAGFTHWIASVVESRILFLEEHDIILGLEDVTFQGFQNACIETMESYETCLEEVTVECSDSHWILVNLALLRHVLFGFIDLVAVTRLAKQHVLLGRKKNLTIKTSLNAYEKLVLSQSIDHYINPADIVMALHINHYIRDPKIAPFSIDMFVYKCCTPVLMFCTLELVLEYQLFNPYYNNNIGYHRGNKLYYILYDVKDNKRYWVADPNLGVFIRNIGSKLVCFLYKTFRQLFYNVYNTNEFRSSKGHPRHNEFLMLLRNWKLAKNLPLLAKIIQKLTIHYAEIYATDLDYFNITNPDLISELPVGEIQCAGLYDIPKVDEGWCKLKV